MESEFPRNPGRRDAYWNPDLRFEYGGASSIRIGKTSSRARSGAWPVVWLWQPLAGAAAWLAEHLALLLIFCFIAFPGRSILRLSWLVRWGAKRSLDILGAAIGLMLALPVFLLIPVLIKLDSPGPVFYRQARVGRDRRRYDRRALGSSLTTERRTGDRRKYDQHGRIFNLIKFRSMVHNAERTCGPVWATHNDPRITRLGRFLRRSRIDEIPQLLNVLAGHMSLVGPRPERPHFVTQFSQRIDAYSVRHWVRPGITGLAQIENGYDASEEDVQRKVVYDLDYIRKLNAFVDVRILLRTVKVIFTGRGAH